MSIPPFLNTNNVCSDLENVKGLFSLEFAPTLLFYTYLPLSILVIFLSIYLLLKSKLNYKIFFFITMAFFFVVWSLNEIYQWIAVYSTPTHFSWQMNILISSLFIASMFYLIYLFSRDYLPPFKNNLLIFIATLPFIIFLPTKLNVYDFDLSICGPSQGILWNYFYIYSVGILAFSFYEIFRRNKNESRLIKYSLVLSLFLYSFSIFFGDITLIYEFNLIGPIGVIIFVLTLFYSIATYKTFKIKLLIPQILIGLLLFLNFAILFIRQIEIVRIVMVITILLIIFLGRLLIRSVKVIDQQRELLDVANKNQQNLLHFITHQVKGYMTKSRNIFDGILSGDYGKTGMKIKEVAKYGLDSETRGVETVQAILHASDLKNGVVEFDKQELDMRQLVLEQIENIKPKIEEKNLKIVEKFPADKMIIDGDDLKLKEVVKNLLENAVIYTPSGEIEISLSEKDGRLRFSVKDSGVGLTKEDKKNLFTEGGKGRNSIDQNVDTTGYGLFIARQIIREHGGHIWAESEGEGKGSEFIVELPK